TTALSTAITGALFLGLAASAQAQAVELIYSDTVAETDIRTTLLRAEFGECLGEGFSFQSFHGATLFAQGTELTAMQRGNLDMGNLAPFDFLNQVPETSILGVPFLFRDYDHMRATYDGDVLDDLMAIVEERVGVKVLAFPYIGARHISYIGNRRYMTPEDLTGVRLRMPAGEGWQFVGTAMGATPVPVAFTELYTALQTGAVDAQDNGLPATRSMRFDELITHMGLTSHLIAANLFTISLSKWNSLTPEQQEQVQTCADRFEAALDQITLEQEATLRGEFEANGIDIYEPDNAAFRDRVFEVYRASPYSADWPEGLLDAISAL
ncbi:MAG: TRAP transporter substrate-binding protein DctP, partial [Pararhodobacter sp.]